MKNRTLFISFLNAIDGIYFTIKNERNFRVHIVFSLYTILFSFFYSFNVYEYFLLVLAITSMFVLELINTAVEKTVDLITTKYHPLAKASKDIMSGAVLINSIASIIAGVYLFIRLDKIRLIINLMFSNFAFLIIFIVTLILSYIFITHWKD